MTDDDRALLDQQIDYYRARAPEYDAWWFRTGRFDRGEANNAAWHRDAALVEHEVDAMLARRRPAHVLELACGTGLFTRRLAPCAGRVTAIDAAPEVIAINRGRVGAANVDYVEADLFGFEPPARYDLVFMSFWLSHVPDERFDAFWRTVASALAEGGTAYVIDSAHEPTSTARDHPVPSRDAGVVVRKLDDGRTFRIVKVFWEPEALAARLTPLGWRAALSRTPRYFVHGTLTRA